MFLSLLSISVGAILGSLLRYFLGLFFNSFFPPFPMGTLIANLLGGFLIGIFIGFSKYLFVPEALRLAIVTGFLGGLTTFSTFSAETFSLFSHQEYFWASLLIFSHVAGSILFTFLGFYLFKLCL